MSPLELAIGLPALVASLALLAILGIAVLNALTFPRLRPAPDEARPAAPSTASLPRLSVLVPARDEAETIARTVADLCGQSMADLEVIVLDDGSSDGTAAMAAAGADGDPRVRVLTGQPLPAGWAGKPWACHQLSRAARAERLLFTDADTRWHPDAVGALLAQQRLSGAALVTAWPTQETVTWAERLVVPMMAFVVQGYLPALAVHHLPWPSLSAAVGQCLLFTRAGYEAAGGHDGVRSTVLDDVALARRVKASGQRLRTADAAGLVGCRMYRDWPSVRDGFAKNMLAGYGGSLAALGAATAFHWLILVLPWAWLAGGLLVTLPWWPGWPLGLAALGVGARMVTASSTRQRLRDALLVAVSALLLTAVAWRSARWARSGGARWKGRTIAAGPAGPGEERP